MQTAVLGRQHRDADGDDPSRHQGRQVDEREYDHAERERPQSFAGRVK